MYFVFCCFWIGNIVKHYFSELLIAITHKNNSAIIKDAFYDCVFIDVYTFYFQCIKSFYCSSEDSFLLDKHYFFRSDDAKIHYIVYDTTKSIYIFTYKNYDDEKYSYHPSIIFSSEMNNRSNTYCKKKDRY